ncbi:polysaccharide biosynthesis protein [Hahella sp. SMD15-11]|uniref:Polysaccharide biosynthesis protein n=1 Tax=Thermohahella caldifontis TaxID=3142973 RepID=A0AB39UY81_9GAMM
MSEGKKNPKSGDVLPLHNESIDDAIKGMDLWLDAREEQADDQALQKFEFSRQIKQMREPLALSPHDLERRKIIYPEMDDRLVLDRFRELRTRLLELSRGENFVLLVTSVAPEGGGSFTALNLASAIALDATKTALLIDCNLREPSLHRYLDLVPDMGVTDFIEDPDMEVASIIYPTGIKRLRLIPAGSRRESPSEFFTSFRMKYFIKSIRARYPDRFVIMDAPSISTSPDARILSELADYTLLVVPHARVTPEEVQKAAESVYPGRLAGVVLND